MKYLGVAISLQHHMLAEGSTSQIEAMGSLSFNKPREAHGTKHQIITRTAPKSRHDFHLKSPTIGYDGDVISLGVPASPSFVPFLHMIVYIVQG
jgi:hypothetical protein